MRRSAHRWTQAGCACSRANLPDYSCSVPGRTLAAQRIFFMRRSYANRRRGWGTMDGPPRMAVLAIVLVLRSTGGTMQNPTISFPFCSAWHVFRFFRADRHPPFLGSVQTALTTTPSRRSSQNLPEHYVGRACLVAIDRRRSTPAPEGHEENWGEERGLAHGSDERTGRKRTEKRQFLGNINLKENK
jgi:hypothetical protein